MQGIPPLTWENTPPKPRKRASRSPSPPRKKESASTRNRKQGCIICSGREGSARGAALRRSDIRVGTAARCRWGRGGRELEDEDEEEEDQEVQEGEANEHGEEVRV